MPQNYAYPAEKENLARQKTFSSQKREEENHLLK